MLGTSLIGSGSEKHRLGLRGAAIRDSVLGNCCGGDCPGLRKHLGVREVHAIVVIRGRSNPNSVPVTPAVGIEASGGVGVCRT